MNKKLNITVILLVVFSVILAACAPAVATEEIVVPPTEAPATEAVVVTEAPVVVAPDVATVYAQMIGSLPQGYAGIKPADVNTAMAEATPPFLLDLCFSRFPLDSNE